MLLLPAERQTVIQQFDHSTTQTPSAIEKRLDQWRRKKRQLHDAPDVTRCEALGPRQLVIRGDFSPLETPEPVVGPANRLHYRGVWPSDLVVCLTVRALEPTGAATTREPN